MGIVLVLGGTKTGKTSFAENRAKSLEKSESIPVYYIATANPIDDEMCVRIKKHQEKRSANWKTIEEPVDVSKAINRISNGKSVIILDCLTLLMTNLLFEKGENCPREEAEKVVFSEIDKIVAESEKKDSEIIIISNQVENGLVSEYKWARMFQDIAGITHQKLGSAAEKVYLMNAGIALQIK
ncbi:MAG: bifunctional adenosylcobinamide kinase/adenosylcobinamide-phosphate guanylyltransferase [Deltaproteobacteria bacterium]|nr:bifunctional adenosylcobinamide kinase/adenosylcobinamide-phosphate guanylyltransferase [Deltaproteobacteria bacterium]